MKPIITKEIIKKKVKLDAKEFFDFLKLDIEKETITDFNYEGDNGEFIVFDIFPNDEEDIDS